MTMKCYMNHMNKIMEETRNSINDLERLRPSIGTPNFEYLNILKMRIEIYKESVEYHLSKSVYLDSDEKLIDINSIMNISTK